MNDDYIIVNDEGDELEVYYNKSINKTIKRIIIGKRKKYVLIDCTIEIREDGVFGLYDEFTTEKVPPGVVDLPDGNKAYLIDVNPYDAYNKEEEENILVYGLMLHNILFTARVSHDLKNIEDEVKNANFWYANIMYTPKNATLVAKGFTEIMRVDPLYIKKVTFTDEGVAWFKKPLQEYDGAYDNKNWEFDEWILKLPEGCKCITPFIRPGVALYDYNDVELVVEIDEPSYRSSIYLNDTKIIIDDLDNIREILDKLPIVIWWFDKKTVIKGPWTNYDGDYIKLLRNLLNRKPFFGPIISHPTRETIITPRGTITVRKYNEKEIRKFESIIKYLLGGDVPIEEQKYFEVIVSDTITIKPLFPVLNNPPVFRIGKTTFVKTADKEYTSIDEKVNIVINEKMRAEHDISFQHAKRLKIYSDSKLPKEIYKQILNGKINFNSFMGIPLQGAIIEASTSINSEKTMVHSIHFDNIHHKTINTTMIQKGDYYYVALPYIEGIYLLKIPVGEDVDVWNPITIRDVPEEFIVKPILETNITIDDFEDPSMVRVEFTCDDVGPDYDTDTITFEYKISYDNTTLAIIVTLSNIATYLYVDNKIIKSIDDKVDNPIKLMSLLRIRGWDDKVVAIRSLY